MTKPELLEYLKQAIDAIDDQDLEELFPEHESPDLSAIVEELIGLRGEMKKMTQSALRNNQDVQMLLDKQSALTKMTELQLSIPTEAKDNVPFEQLEEDYRDLVLQIIQFDDIMQRTDLHLQQLPTPTHFNLNAYKTAFSVWKNGHKIALTKWHQLVKVGGLLPTGAVGERFNPEYHEAIAITINPEVAENIIVATEVLGYFNRYKLIRRAKVIVNKSKQ